MPRSVTRAASGSLEEEREPDEKLDTTGWSTFRIRLEKVLSSPITDNLLLLLVIASCVLLIFETNARAETGSFDDPHTEEPPKMIGFLSRAFILTFVIEMTSKTYVYRSKLFDKVSVPDFSLVVIDALLAVLDFFLGTMPSVSFLRIFRLIRIWRFLRIVKRFPELYYLLHGMQAAFFSVMWGLILTLMLFLVWSIIAVITLHPIARKLEERGSYEGCERCPRAFNSVWSAFLTLTQTLLAGDSWGQTALPIIEEEWWTYFIFMGAWASVVLATMNLVLAAIVDSGAQARDEAVEARFITARRLEEDKRKEVNHLLESICQRFDDESSGTLTKEALLSCYENKEFQGAVRSMGYERRDLEVLHSLLDEDNTGFVKYKALLELMFKEKAQDDKRTMVSVKLAVEDIWTKLLKKEEVVEATLREISVLLKQQMPEIAWEGNNNSGTPHSRHWQTDEFSVGVIVPQVAPSGGKEPQNKTCRRGNSLPLLTPVMRRTMEAGGSGASHSKQSEANALNRDKGEQNRTWSKGRTYNRGPTLEHSSTTAPPEPGDSPNVAGPKPFFFPCGNMGRTLFSSSCVGLAARGPAPI